MVFYGTTGERKAVQSGMNVGIGGLTRSTEYLRYWRHAPQERFAEVDVVCWRSKNPGSSNPHYRAWISLHDMTKFTRVAG
jgi:hypothetical protein